MPRAFVSLLLALCITAARAAVDFTALETLARAELARTGVPGCAVAIVIDGQLAYAQGFGLANADTREPVRAEMLFRLGSTTKMFTAATAVSLALDGKLKLDAPIGHIVSGLAPKIARVTPHQLLSHSAGLADDAPMEGPHDDSALAARCRALTDKLVFAEPGKIYSYSNPGFWLAGLAAEVAGGKPYADLVAERVLAPCDMTRSTLRPTMAMTWPLAVGHEGTAGQPARVIRPLADNASTWPAGQLFASAPEFARFAIALMNGGKLDGRQALPAALVTRLTNPHVATAGEGGHYGYGLAVREESGRRWWSHTGARAGYGSIVRMCPDRGFAVIVLCNRTGDHLPRVAEKAVELVLGVPPPPRPAAQKLTPTADDRRRLVGTFTNGSASVVIRERDGQLVGAQGGVFTKTGENRFTRSAVGNTPATEFLLTAGLDGTGTFLVRGGRALRKVE
ncbi:MAG: beta-lactamase family protein [Verrucomicrobia bacterium]|nr:beta-lactamase family protein [Verrucomicrobiota bacterium]